MEPANGTERPDRIAAPGLAARLSGYVADALRYWEPRRVVYNLGLALVVLGHTVAAWPVSSEKFSFDVVLGLFVLAVGANICYCVVYLVDLFVQFAGLQGPWRRGRVALLVIGTTLGAVIAHFISREFFSA
jgi:hypothetical protein